jgi:hypothetical protein
VKTRIALLYPGDRAMRDRADPRESRFSALFEAFAAAGVNAEPAVYQDDFANEVRAQLLSVQGVLVWHNPIESGPVPRTRAVLDAMLRDVAERGVLVSAHPDTILRLGTKDVLLAVRDLPFGSDTVRVDNVQALRGGLPARLARGARVLKQHRGHSGIGVWRVEARTDGRFALRHAQRGAVEELVDFETVVQRLAPYFNNDGHMVDQAWQSRLAEGMTRAYLVRDRVAGFGHQAVNALCPALDGEPAPPPGPRLYSGPDDARFQGLRERLESGWVRALCEATGTSLERLPLLWDADFLLGEGQQSHVLCEINVSSVSPFPESATGTLVLAAAAAIHSRSVAAAHPCSG